VREVVVPTGFLALLRQCRAPLIAVAIALVVLQTLVAGLATARAASLPAAAPFDAICHGAGGPGGGADQPADGAPHSGKARDVCCAFCAATAPAVLPVASPIAGRFEHTPDASRATVGDIVLIARRAVRVGPSQAPPSFA
jgi:hypothetical protein